MARSSYIYVLWDADLLRGTFTVKHEMMTYIERHPADEQYFAHRHKDGHPEVPVTSVDLTK